MSVFLVLKNPEKMDDITTSTTIPLNYEKVYHITNGKFTYFFTSNAVSSYNQVIKGLFQKSTNIVIKYL